MRNIKLLDCTLRDGGYVNDWEFGHNNLISIYERLIDAGVDIVEVGFLDDRRPFDINRSIFPDTESCEKIWGKVGKRPPIVVGMIDYGTCSIEHLQPCEKSYLDGIRVIFKQHIMKEALDFCAQVKKLGYKVFAQLVSVTTYDDNALKELAGLINEVEPYAVSMVDTYGLLDPPSMLHIYEKLDEYVKPCVNIGFHAHNNFQLAYANARAFVARETERDILVDGTLFGMGKSAGNAPLELLAMFLNNELGKEYRIDSMMESIEESVLPFYREHPWGYKTFFYLCAKNRCHPSYETYFLNKENLSVSDLDKIMGEIEPNPKKLLYDKEIAEKLYQNYVAEECDDSDDAEGLSQALEGRKILVLGPGKNIQLQKDAVDEFIKENNPVVISINYIPGAFDVDYVFTTNALRYRQMTDALYEIKNRNIKIIATSNITAKLGEFAYKFNRAPLLEFGEHIRDNSLLMLLKLFDRLGIKSIACAGFDGYSDREDNYYNPGMEYDFVKSQARHLNMHMRKVLVEDHADVDIDFITYSHYTEENDSHSAAF